MTTTPFSTLPLPPSAPSPRFINTLPFLLPFLPLSSFAFFLFSFLATLSSPLWSASKRVKKAGRGVREEGRTE